MRLTKSIYRLMRSSPICKCWFTGAIAFAICAVLALATLSCKDIGVGPGSGGQTGFSVKFTVTRPNGQPAGGLELSAFNQVHIAGVYGQNLQKRSPQNVNSTSTLEFGAPQSAFVSLAVFDLDGTLVSTIMDDRRVVGGKYAATFFVPRPYGTRVYKCVLVATDTASGAMLYRDSVYAALCNIDPSLAVIGTTSASGTFQTQDSLLFPNVLSLPRLILTSSVGPDSLGTFQLVDAVNVVLTDTAARQSESYLCTVQAGSNDIHLVWNPSTSKIQVAQIRRSEALAKIRQIRSVGGVNPNPGVPARWSLSQNYPNPFD